MEEIKFSSCQSFIGNRNRITNKQGEVKMAKKRVEEEMPDLENIKLDTTPAEHMQAVPQMPVQQEVKYKRAAVREERQAGELVNPLRKETVIVKFVPSPNALVHSKGHVLSGGMADGSTKTYVVPKLRNGQYVNVLTDSEMAFLEHIMRLEPGALSIYNRTNNYWDDSNEHGFGVVTLHKQNNYLDLSDPIDYIKYKVLLANKDNICPSLKELEDRPKATYQFVIINENAETQMNLSKNDAKREGYIQYGKVSDDADVLRTILEILTGRPVGNMTKLDFLQAKTMDEIEKDPRRFLSIIKDELLPAKVLIKKSVEAGLISRRNDLYYYDGSPMCLDGEDSTLTNAAKYLSNIKRQELKFSLEARLKR
jgi:hypothetical protein